MPLSNVSTPTQYDLRPDWMKPGFAEKAKANHDAYLEEIKNREIVQDEDEDEDKNEDEDPDYFYKECAFAYLTTMIKDVPDDCLYYVKIHYKIQRLDEELHPWNYTV